VPGTSTLYLFFDDGGWVASYVKSTDNGETWGAPVAIGPGFTDGICGATWYDKWTPGDSGTLIHIFMMNTGNDDVFYRTLDTDGDVLGTTRTVYAGTTVSDNRALFVAGCKLLNGDLICAFNASATERGLRRSQDAGVNWAVLTGDPTVMEADGDQASVFPASNTGDGADFWMLYHDADADELSLKDWDDSTTTLGETSIATGVVENATIYVGEYAWAGAAVRPSDGHLIARVNTEYDAATADHRIFDINGPASIVEKTAIATDKDDHYYGGICIDQYTDDLYVLFTGATGTDEVLGSAAKTYYKKSVDGGATWSADQPYMENAAAAVLQCWVPMTGDLLYGAWRIGTTLLGGFTNRVAFSAPAGALDADYLFYQVVQR
jgi:hypothetical protein